MKWSNFLIDPVFHYTLYEAQDWLSDNCIWCRTYEREQMAHRMKNDKMQVESLTDSCNIYLKVIPILNDCYFY